jgi:hypothetical protein
MDSAPQRPRMSFTPSTRRSIGSFHASSAGAWNGVLGDGGVGILDPQTADLDVGLAGTGVRIDRCAD